ncbi:serine hydrolase domain-containing protein [Phytoactinopolyspora mesophila]|uniref:Serine hydrolase n=1 Tax=Phytoactinopolyspora mesophila TaxID=2650750 RepID=A0A7K3MBJ9_9ACTN|nr:serine hydrolase domain-containing protein [Phytoactinopolyspora mesophila]NDL60673.1 serine hydrolase [Phytoactinopolyspora mesophila]
MEIAVTDAVRPRTAERLLNRLAAEQADSRLPSVAAGLVRDGTLVWSAARGSVDGSAPTADTQYRMGSITKTFVAVCVMRLRDEGRLALTDRIADHLPGTPLGGATIAQLLSHAAGLQAETDGPWWERTAGGDWDSLAVQLGDGATRHRPGSRFHYSNVGFGVLGELIARMRRTSWDDAVRTEILDPLGMRRTTTRPVAPAARGYAVHPWADVLLPEPEHDAGAMAPAGQLWSTVADLSRWAAFLAGDTADVLSADTLAEMTQPQMVDDPPEAAWQAGYGLGIQLWNLDGTRYAGHGGSMPGFLAVIRVDLSTRDGVIVMTNNTSSLGRDLAPDLLAILAAEEPVLPDEWRPSPVPGTTLEIVGPWYWGPAPLLVKALPDGWLEIGGLTGPTRSAKFRPNADGTWTGLSGYYAGETLRVVRTDDGTVRHLDLASFCFTRTPYDPAADVPGGVDAAGWSA